MNVWAGIDKIVIYLMHYAIILFLFLHDSMKDLCLILKRGRRLAKNNKISSQSVSKRYALN